MPRFPRWPKFFVRRSRCLPPPTAHVRTVSFRSARYALLAVAVAVGGCSSKKIEGRKAVFPARGKLLIDGQPAKGALLVLHPTDPLVQSEHPFAHIDSDGRFEISTYQGHDGAPAGEYIATVEWRVPRNTGDEGPWPNALPDRYARAATSGLRVRIAQEPNDLPPILLQR